MLLDDFELPEIDANALISALGEKDHHEKRDESGEDLYGSVFYSFGLLALEAVIHLVGIKVLCHVMAMPQHALPGLPQP